MHKTCILALLMSRMIQLGKGVWVGFLSSRTHASCHEAYYAIAG
jgi:hypothetical protein